MPEQKKIPMRRCTGCMQSLPKKELVRIDRLTKRRNEIRNNLLVLKSEFAQKSSNPELMKELKKRNSDFYKEDNAPVSTYIIDKTK